ncbi:MAG: pantoate--beta-alanine ligase [Rhodoferax sp.]|nr:pantoate--beta-alanine ligase [Rhodoferax sp.]
MQIIHTLSALRAQLKHYRHPAVVPTMGNLHAGHLALVETAKPLGDVTLATIFVNRLQFGPSEDFDSYPRTLAEDCAKLESAGCDMVFAPAEQELYPPNQHMNQHIDQHLDQHLSQHSNQQFLIQPPAALADILEGQFRPGFFTGVATVVMKLLSATQARSAVFGKKDYQQLMVIRQLVRQFCLPVDIIGVETCRAADGLALSSRNGYLSTAERAGATLLSHTLNRVAHTIRTAHSDRMDYTTLEAEAMQMLRQADWQPDYVAVRRRLDLQAPQTGDALVVLAAARLGKTRLIDNLEV